MVINEKDNVRNSVETHSEADENVKALVMKFAPNRFYYNPYSAGFHILAEDVIYETRAIIKLEAVPFSKVRSSTLEYDELDLERERIASYAFFTSIAALKPHEFIRSSVFSFYLDTYEYNHFLFGAYNLKIHFNKIWNMPNLKASPKEISLAQEASNIKTDLNDPKNYYCLGMFNERSNSWRCVSREIVSLSETVIEFKSIITGTFAILFFPRKSSESTALCGFFCRYKKEIFTFIFIIIPIFAIIIAFISKIARDAFLIAQKKLKAITAMDNEALFKSAKAAQDANQSQKGTFPKKSKILKNDADDDFDLTSNMETFQNPLIFAANKNIGELGQEDLEQEKGRLKYKNELSLNEKLKLLRKMAALAGEVDLYKENIDKLKSMQELNGIEKLENQIADRLPEKNK